MSLVKHTAKSHGLTVPPPTYSFPYTLIPTA